MWKAYMALAGGCLLYIGFIYSVTGFSTQLTIFWGGLAILFVVLSGITRFMQMHSFVLPKTIKVILLSVILIGGVFFGILEGIIIYHGNASPQKDADYMLILGAQVRGKTVSTALQKRLDTALIYAKENPDTKIIVSGGQGLGEDISEAEAMEVYLTERGIESSRIIKEEASTNTDENVKKSKALIVEENPSIVVVSNAFHLFRSICICNKNGLTDVTGLGASTPFGLHANSYAREAVALCKDFLVGNI